MSRTRMPGIHDDARISAILGPTNTGKTHTAIERMLLHKSGMMGLPLRLLAREVYERIVARTSPEQVALVTGEQKIVPSEARYFICTVEAMPVSRPVSFLAIDEVQLAGHRQRGRVFTERVLHARGLRETLFLGSDSAERMLRRLVPGLQIERRPRMSTLRYAGTRKLTALPPRTAVIAFSAAEVYAHAERLRRRHGGTAVVLGAMSPRARNAQVELFQSGEVSSIVATDAIGMGLNLDIDHVAFSALRKFDGFSVRDLTPAELAQIAGRAGRHTRDGTFGTLNALGPLEPEVVEAIESHSFPMQERWYWRRSRLDMTSLGGLLRTLRAPPPDPSLIQVRDGLDHKVVEDLAQDADLAALVDSPEAVALLWEVAQTPDFRRTLMGGHTELVAQVFRFVRTTGELPEDWLAGRLQRLDRTDGDIETLMARLAYTRTFTYLSNKSAWLKDPAHWQAFSLDLEERLSDALHERLRQRFVDERALVFDVDPTADATAWVGEGGEVTVGGHQVGVLTGLSLRVDRSALGDSPAVKRGVRRVVRATLAARSEAIASCVDDALSLDLRGRVCFEGEPLATLETRGEPLMPGVRLRAHELLEATDRQRVVERLLRWVREQIATAFAPLVEVADLSPGVRGVLFAVVQGFGSVRRHELRRDLEALTREERKVLGSRGVRLGLHTVFLDALLTPEALRLRVALLRAAGADPVPLPEPLGTAFPAGPEVSPKSTLALGFLHLGSWALRVDVAERLAGVARKAARSGPFDVDLAWCAWAGVGPVELTLALTHLGFEERQDGRLERASTAQHRRDRRDRSRRR